MRQISNLPENRDCGPPNLTIPSSKYDHFLLVAPANQYRLCVNNIPLVEERNPTVNHTPSCAQATLKLSAVFGGVFMLGLSACQPLVPPTISPPGQSGQAVVTVPITVPGSTEAATKTLGAEDIASEPIAGPASEGTNTDTAAIASTVAVPVPTKPPEKTGVDPRSFLKKPLQNMTNILGEADFTRVEGQIGIWQFRQKNCVVDFFFRAADANGAPSRQLIIALDVRSRIIGQPLDEKGCRKELYQRRL